MVRSSPAVEKFREVFEATFQANKFVVFLCGPSIKNERNLEPAAALRARLKNLLIEKDFDVVLGEDDGLELLRDKYKGAADHNELAFVESLVGAVVIVADSIGSFCETGLFSYFCSPGWSESTYRGDIILIADEAYKKDQSYFNNGPVQTIDTLGGKVFFTDFDSFNMCLLVDRLMSRRTVWTNKIARQTT